MSSITWVLKSVNSGEASPTTSEMQWLKRVSCTLLHTTSLCMDSSGCWKQVKVTHVLSLSLVLVPSHCWELLLSKFLSLPFPQIPLGVREQWIHFYSVSYSLGAFLTFLSEHKSIIIINGYTVPVEICGVICGCSRLKALLSQLAEHPVSQH